MLGRLFNLKILLFILNNQPKCLDFERSGPQAECHQPSEIRTRSDFEP